MIFCYVRRLFIFLSEEAVAVGSASPVEFCTPPFLFLRLLSFLVSAAAVINSILVRLCVPSTVSGLEEARARAPPHLRGGGDGVGPGCCLHGSG